MNEIRQLSVKGEVLLMVADSVSPFDAEILALQKLLAKVDSGEVADELENDDVYAGRRDKLMATVRAIRADVKESLTSLQKVRATFLK